MSWASKRRAQYLFGVFLFFGLILFLILYPYIFKKPTCADGKQNGTETGVDCGGSCLSMCPNDVSEPIVVWARAVPVIDNIYNLVALVENPNKISAIENAKYEFRVYNTNNELVGVREGSTFISPNKRFAVFEPRFDLGEGTLKSVTFDFIAPYDWVKKETKLDTLPIRNENIVFENSADYPSLSLSVKNDSIYNLPEFDVISILYDIDGNVINASKTHKNPLASGEASSVFFTWPKHFDSIPVVKDIFVLINPFNVSF